MATERNGRPDSTSMADARDDRALRRGAQPEVAAGAGSLPAGPVHAGGAGGDGAPLAGGETRRPGAAVHGDRREDGGVDGDRDARGALAQPRRRRLPDRDRQGEEGGDRLTIAVPVKGRLREPAVRLLVDARCGGAGGIGVRAARGARGRDGCDGLSAPDARADAGRGRARRRHRLRRDRAAARPRPRHRRSRLVGEHVADERAALARHPLPLGGGADRGAGRRRVPARLDDARRRRGARAPLPDARPAAVHDRGDPLGHRLALPERAAARRPRHGRRARARARQGRLAAAAAARGGRGVLDPRRPRRADAQMSSIVAQIKESGEEAVWRWAEELDGVEPALAHLVESSFPREALLALADRVRRWHEAQRPADITLEVEPGVTLQRRWVPLETVGIYVPRNLISTLVMCVVPAQVAGVRKLVVCTPPQGAGLVAAAAAALEIDEVWALGGP